MGIAELVGVVLFGAVVVLAYFAWRRVRLLRAGGVHVALRSRIEDSGGVGTWASGTTGVTSSPGSAC